MWHESAVAQYTPAGSSAVPASLGCCAFGFDSRGRTVGVQELTPRVERLYSEAKEAQSRDDRAAGP